jgi:hypothetical protein
MMSNRRGALKIRVVCQPAEAAAAAPTGRSIENASASADAEAAVGLKAPSATPATPSFSA